eukprot:scaffold243471_cov15-Tisochrysis_lutea.AAC.1
MACHQRQRYDLFYGMLPCQECPSPISLTFLGPGLFLACNWLLFWIVTVRRKRRPDEEIEGSVADGLGGSGPRKSQTLGHGYGLRA